MFEQVDVWDGDPILSLQACFMRDPRAEKINLSIGLYYDEQGQVAKLATIHEAENRLHQQRAGATCYLPMHGLPALCTASQQLLFGTGSPLLTAGQLATIQTIGASGALKIGADFMQRYFPQAQIWVSSPTWENHCAIFAGAGFKVNAYPWYDSQRHCVDFPAFLHQLQAIPRNDILVLHPCCHNPTGCDLTPAQWDQALHVMQQRQLIPFFDMAYLGLAQGMDEDAYAVRCAAALALPLLVSHSFSKIFSLYGERTGTLTLACQTAEEAARVNSQLQATVRRNYSSPPAHGAYLAALVLHDDTLRQQWETEVSAMRQRLKMVRQTLVQALQQRAPQHNFAYLLTQQGMFSYIGLTQQQVITLRERHAIYLLDSGRLCVAGLNSANIETVAEAIAHVVNTTVAPK